MDYLNSFINHSMAFLKGQIATIPDSESKSQQKFEFEQELKRKIRFLETELLQQADNWCDFAQKNGHPDNLKLWSDLKNEIRTLLRNWEYEQKESSGILE